MNDEKHIFQIRDKWIQRYNTFTLTESHDPVSVNVLNDKVTDLCKEYILSLLWTSHYYFQECISQEWYYPYEFAPTLYDLSLYLQTAKRNKVKPHSKTYSPKEQLEFIFPKQSYSLSSELNDEGLEEFTGFEKTFTLLKRYDWECEPIFTHSN
jgi:5'-3' exonuclease